MNLRLKTIIIHTITFGGLFVILGAFVCNMLVRGFRDFEERTAMQNVERAMLILKENVRTMDQIALDWAAWDDTLTQIAGSNVTIETHRVIDQTLAGLQLNYIGCYDTAGALVWRKAFDLARGCEMAMPEGLDAHLQPDALLVRHCSPTNIISGILRFSNEVMFVAARPMLHGVSNGPVRGVLVVGRLLNAAEQHRLTKVAGLAIDVMPTPWAYQVQRAEGAAAWLNPVDVNTLYACALLRDIYGAPCATLRVVMTRDIWREARFAGVTFIMTLLVVGTVFALVSLLGLEWLVLRGVSRLNAQVTRIGMQRKVLAAVPVSRSDELGELAGSINTMLSMLAEVQDAQQAEAERVVRYHAAIVDMTKISWRDAAATRARILEMAAEALDVAYAGFWRLSAHRSELVCEDRFIASSRAHESGNRLRTQDYPQYFKAVEHEHSIAADDARQDPRTSEFTSGHFASNGIFSTLDVPVRLQGDLLGVVCFEHAGAQRHWGTAELEFAWSVADLMVLVLEAAERTRVEQALRESQKRLALAQRFAHIGTWDWDIVADIDVWSPTTKAIYGLPEDDEPVTNQQFFSLIHSDDHLRVVEAINACVERGAGYAIQYRIKRPDGTLRWVAERGNVVRDGDGKALRMLGTAMDITERKQAEDALAAEKERLAVTLRSIGDAVITTDIAGRITLMNRVAEQLTKWPSAEAIGRPLGDVFAIVREGTRAPRENPVERVLNSGAIITMEDHTILIARDGTEHIIEDSGAPIRDNESAIVGVILVFRDVTAKQLLEEELYKVQKLDSIGILAGGIAHDFNNILTIILGNISLAKLQMDATHDMHDRLTDAENAIAQAMSLTYQLLTFSRGGLPVRKVAAVDTLIKDTVSFACRGSNVRYSFAIEPRLWSACIDAGQIGQVINNLVINAVQAMSGGGLLDVCARNVRVDGDASQPVQPGRYIRISVADQGTGIPNEHLDRIFDPYFTTKQKGSGLGLAVSYSIVRNHEGHIQVESELGTGTTFHVFLPASDVSANTDVKPVASVGTASGRVLIMDDEQVILRTTSELIVKLGYSVDTAADGDEALAKYQCAMSSGNRFDAVILDLTIQGGMGGKETVCRMLALDPDVRVIASSGYSTDPIMANPRGFGFVGTLKKPYTMTDLQETLRAVRNQALSSLQEHTS